MGSSNLERDLAQVLDFASRDQNAPWPYPPPIREFHPMWCCEHPKREHWTIPPARPSVPGKPHCRGCFHPGGSLGEYHEYSKERNYRVDFAWPAQRVIVEVEGIRYDKQGGRHQTGSGFAKDLEKYTTLELAGWRVIRVSRREITSGEALALIEKALKAALPVQEEAEKA